MFYNAGDVDDAPEEEEEVFATTLASKWRLKEPELRGTNVSLDIADLFGALDEDEEEDKFEQILTLAGCSTCAGESDASSSASSSGSPRSSAAAEWGDCVAEEAGASTTGEVGSLLARLAASPARANLEATAFTLEEEPALTIEDYVARVARHLACSSECFVIALVYMDRLAKLHPERYQTDRLNVHRLLAVSAVIAAKVQDDFIHTMSDCARVLGMPVDVLAALEREMLRLLDFKVFVTPAEYQEWLAVLAAEDIVE